MGFQLEETHYALSFEDPALNGLEATVREVSTDEFLELAELVERVKVGGVAAAKSVRRLFELVASGLVEWNVTKNDEPVSADYEGLTSYPPRICMAIAGAWVSSMAEVDVPLASGSSDGGTSLEPSIPMEVS